MTPPDPSAVERDFAEMLDRDGLPRFDSTFYDADLELLELRWDHGLTMYFDLAVDEPIEPLDELERRAILGLPTWPAEAPIHITVPGSPDDPRARTAIPGVEIHYTPPLHPDDVMMVGGLPVTTPSRTLIDLAEVMDRDELVGAFSRALEVGLLDAEQLRAARARVEWRPSLAMFDAVMAEFCGDT